MTIATLKTIKKIVITASMATAALYRKGDYGGFQLAEFYDGRKGACKSKAVITVVEKRKSRSSSSSSSSSSSCHNSADYSEKRREIEESITLKYTIKDMIPGCGSIDDYEILNLISSGAYGVVYRARDHRNGEIVAVKEETKGLSVASLREIQILKSLRRHRNIVEFKEVAGDDGDGVYVVMEYVEYDLSGYMEVKDLSLSEIKYLMKEVLEGVKFLHENMVMHRDIKPDNILVDTRGELKLCDFGLSRRMEAEKGWYSTHVGTLPYKAPELLLGRNGYSTAVDMWAVGCTMAELLLKRELFGGRQTDLGQLKRIYGILGPPGFEGCNVLRKEFAGGGGDGGAPLLTEGGFDLLRRLLSYDPDMRITAEAALRHVWFQESS